MNREEYIDLFHRAEVNLVAFKQVNDCGEELRKMVEMAVKAEREACAKLLEQAAEAAKNADPQGFVWQAVKASVEVILARGQA